MNPFRLTPFELKVKIWMDKGMVTSRCIADCLRTNNETLVSKAMGAVDRWNAAQTGEIGCCRGCRRTIRYVNGTWHHVNGREYAHTPTPRVIR